MKETVVSSPGKVILHGEHAVVYGKAAVASSLNLRCYLRLVPNDDGLVSLDLPNVDIHCQWPVDNLYQSLLSKIPVEDNIDEPKPPNEETLMLLKQFAKIKTEDTGTNELAVISFLYLCAKILANGKGTIPAFSVRLVSQQPVGAGLGSSAAYCVCLAAVFLQSAGNIGDPTVWQGAPANQGSGDLKTVGWPEEERTLINKWAFVGEKILHGQPSGIDNSISSLGGAIRFQNKKITSVEKMPRLRILLTNTKVPRSTKTLVAKVADRHRKYKSVIAPVIEAMEGVVEKGLEVYAELYSNPNSDEAYSQLEELIDINQNLLGAMGVSHATLERIVAITKHHGLHTKLTGAGGGGCAYTLLRPDLQVETVSKACQELQEAGFDCWETSIGGPGVMCHPHPSTDLSIPPQLFM